MGSITTPQNKRAITYTMLRNTQTQPFSIPLTQPIQATICDLNGNPIRASQPIPILRRSVSGRLFQPCNQVVKASELIDHVYVTPKKALHSQTTFAMKGDMVKRGPVIKKVHFQPPNIEANSSAPMKWTSAPSASKPSQRKRAASVVKAHSCDKECEGQRCLVGGIVHFGRRDSDTLPPVLQTVIGAEQASEFRYGPDDVWMQIAIEQEVGGR
jgi:hypothetical protein